MSTEVARCHCPDLRDELAALVPECGQLATGEGWPRGLELSVAGTATLEATPYPCPYGDFSHLAITDAVVERLGPEPSYRDVLTLATLEPELFG